MNDDAFNLSLRKFLKMVGVGSQREMGQAIAKALAEGKIDGHHPVRATMTLSLPDLGTSVTFDSQINLDADE